MSSEWPVVAIEDVCSLIVDCVNKTAPVVSEVTPYRMIRTTNVRNGRIDLNECRHVERETYEKWTRRSQLQHGDVILTREAPIGEVGLVTECEGVFLGQRLMQYRANPAVLDSRFLLYSFLSPSLQHQFGSHEGSGSVVSHIRVGDCFKFKLSLPPLQVQQGIASLLGALDDRITLLRETNATLEAIAQALFKSWFVDFDPVRAKMEGRAPEGIHESTAALFPDALEESELGWVPKGWKVGQVADLGDVVCGKTPPTSVPENYGGDVPFITIPDMHDLLVVTTTARSLSKEGADGQAKKYLPPGAICVSCIATPGLVVRVTTTAQTNQQINSVIPLKKWGGAFPLFLLRRIGDAVRSGGSGGSVFHNLSKSGFEQLPVLLTAPELADRFSAVVEPLVGKIVANQEQAQTLSTLRDTLLPRLISGQLRLPEAQAATEVALGDAPQA